MRAIVRIFVVALLGPAVLVLLLRWIPPLTSSFMLQRQVGALVRGEDPWIYYRWVGWREIPAHTKLAAIAAEDQKFPDHWGFDLESIADAANAVTSLLERL